MKQRFRWPGFRVAFAFLLFSAAIIAFLMQVYKVYHVPLNETDFRYVWLAGKLWGSHENPYSAKFISVSAAHFGNSDKLSVWVYPFQWYCISIPFSLFSASVALQVWRVLSYTIVFIVWVFSYCTFRALDIRVGLVAAAAFTLYAATFTPLNAILQLGQPVVLSVFGFALLLFGLTVGRNAFTLSGIILLALKPQFGLPILLMFATTKNGFRLCVFGAFATLALAIPPLLSSGAGSQVAGLLTNIAGGYDSVPINRPIAMVGLPNLLAVTAKVNIPISVGLLCAAMASITIGIIINRSANLTSADRMTHMAAFSAISTTCLVGVHPSDLTVLLVVLPLILRQDRYCRLVGIAGYILLWRFENLARLMAPTSDATNVTIATFSTLLIGLSWAANLFVSIRRKTPC